MIDKLYEVEASLMKDILSKPLNTLRIDYHQPFVNRIWYQYDETYRVYLHKIFPAKTSNDALFHPHPWKSAIRIISGRYEMGVGHSNTNKIPKIDCKLVLSAGTVYEMLEEDGWHYVNPIKKASYSLMVTGELNKRKMPIEPLKEFRKLNKKEISEILEVFETYYRSIY